MNRFGASSESEPLADLRWQISAVSDLADIRDYIALTSPLAAQSVVERVLRSVDHLIPETREVVVPGLPYVVVYRYGEDRVDIVGVFHGAQDRR